MQWPFGPCIAGHFGRLLARPLLGFLGCVFNATSCTRAPAPHLRTEVTGGTDDAMAIWAACRPFWLDDSTMLGCEALPCPAPNVTSCAPAAHLRYTDKSRGDAMMQWSFGCAILCNVHRNVQVVLAIDQFTVKFTVLGYETRSAT